MSEDKIRQSLKTRIADINGDVISIELPIDEETGQTTRLSVGSEWNVWYLGDDGSRYDFQTVVKGTVRENIPLLLITVPDKSQIIRTQRRDYLRVMTSAEMAVKLENATGKYHFLTKTVDLSGGGLAFTCPVSYKIFEQDLVYVWISLPMKAGNILHAHASGEVIRIRPAENVNHQLVSLKFVQISEADRAKLIRACYERQLVLRKKGIIN